MAEKTLKPDSPPNRRAQNVPLIRRGEQSGKTLNAAIIGGGKACENLLHILSHERLNRLNMKVLGVADPNPDAPGIAYAREQGIFTTRDFKDLYSLPDLNLLIELTGSTKIREQMIRTKPFEISSIDHRGARLLWDLVQIEAEKIELMRESEKKLHQFLESAHDMICVKDLEGRYLYLNSACATSMGGVASDVIGKTDSDFFPDSIAHSMRNRDKEVFEKKKTLSFVEKMVIQGQTHHFHTVRMPIMDENGETTSIAIISRDMTEEMTLQEEVRQHKEYLESVLGNTSDMIITTDLEGRIVTFNRGGEIMLGYDREEMMGAKIDKFWRFPEARRKLMKEVKAKRTVNNYPAVIITKEGKEVEISLSLSQLKDSKGRILGTVGISKDVTEENRLRRQLIEQERLAAVGQTVAGVTHYMKNVLNGLKGGAYMVNVGLKRNDAMLLREGWENVQKGIDRIGTLSMDMLTYCRERKPHPVPLDAFQLARETVQIMSSSASQGGINIICEKEPGTQANLDPDTVNRALLNLLTNAIDACNEKTYARGETPEIEVSVFQEAGNICFVVRDNGAGIKENVREQLFNRFFSTKEAKGTGLGLCVTDKIIKEHEGSITVESEPGKGATFSIEIPDKPVS